MAHTEFRNFGSRHPIMDTLRLPVAAATSAVVLLGLPGCGGGKDQSQPDIKAIATTTVTQTQDRVVERTVTATVQPSVTSSETTLISNLFTTGQGFIIDKFSNRPTSPNVLLQVDHTRQPDTFTVSASPGRVKESSGLALYSTLKVRAQFPDNNSRQGAPVGEQASVVTFSCGNQGWDMHSPGFLEQYAATSPTQLQATETVKSNGVFVQKETVYDLNNPMDVPKIANRANRALRMTQIAEDVATGTVTNKPISTQTVTEDGVTYKQCNLAV